MFRYSIAAVVVLAVLVVAGVAGAAEVEGKIQSIDIAERAIVLDNGTKVWLGAGVGMDGLREGVEVQLSYDERDGKNVATSVQVK